jgi:cell pole-organizing protein PopZ
MASPANPQHEPTMEEILASIRKIISEDSSDAAAPPVAETVQEESEILELTEEVPPESAQGLRAAEPDEVVFTEVEEPKMAESSNSLSTGSEIFSDKTRAALDDTFAGLSESVPPAAERATLPPIEGNSIEAVFQRTVRDSFEPLLRNHLEAHSDALMAQMKPLIREWMDENFPALLEDAVRSEVARVVKARSRR